ncbi:MAG TPA: EamA family transporter RarD [Lapillicoccus sp.]
MTGPPETRSSTSVEAPRDEQRRGVVQGFCAYAIWGLFPLYFHALLPAGAWEILAHRIAWTFVFCLLLLAIRRDWSWIRSLLGRRRFIAGIAVAAVLIAVNWVLYVSAVVSGNVSEAALGYFLNPIVTVALGVIVLRERLRPLQWVAVAIGLVAALYLSIGAGRIPWIALALAVTFALYGLLKKRLGATLPALHGLTVETTVLLPVALGLVLWLSVTGTQTFTTEGTGHAALLVLSGAVTAAPLLLFAASARRVPLVTVGLLQFVTPVMQLLCGVVLLGESMSSQRWVGFGIVWLALIVLTVDSLMGVRRRRLRDAADDGVCEPAP